jgi:hypothetical protein
MLSQYDMVRAVTKDCPQEDCRITFGMMTRTLMAWQPSYDKKGNMMGGDPNTTTQSVSCQTCGKTWQVKSQYDKVTGVALQAPVDGY